MRTRGMRCALCGYSRNSAALNGHHRDPSVRRFELDLRALSIRTEDELGEECAKCDLVCAKCPAEVHNPGASLYGALRAEEVSDAI